MAKVFLEAGDDYRVVNDGTTVYGVAGDDTDSVVIESGATGVTVNANVDRIDFAGSIADFTFQAGFGNNMMVYSADGTTLIGTIPVQEDANGTQLVFSDGSINTIFDGTSHTTGGVTLTSTTAAITPDAGDIDDTTTTEANMTPVVPAASLSVADVTVAEDGVTATFTVSLSTAPGTGESLTVDYATADGTATAGTDYTAASGTLTFAVGETSKTITVDITDDFDVEGDETFTVALSNVAGTIGGDSAVINDAEATGTITNDDVVPTYTLTSDGVTMNTEGDTVTFTVTPSSGVLEATTFTYSITGNTLGGAADAATSADFSAASGSVTFAAGDTAAKTVTVDLTAADGTESLEGYTFTLLDSSPAALLTVNGQIIDSSGATGGGTVYTLTTTTDAVPGTANNDTITALSGATAAVATDTLTAVDTIDGAGGTDTLNITVTDDNTDVTHAALISNVEIVNIRSTGAGKTATLNASTIAGLTTVNADQGVGAVTVTALATGSTIGVIGNGTVANGTTSFAYSTATTAQKINVTGGTTAGDITATASTGVTAATISSLGTTANKVGTVKLDSAGNNTVTSLTVNADAGLTATLTANDFAATAALVVTGAASTAYTGSVAAVDLGITFDGKTIDASAMTAGGVQIALNTNITSFKGGAGTDVVTLTAIASTTAGAVDGAAGTDTLISTKSDFLDTASEAAVFTNFEKLSATDGASDVDTDTYDMSLLSSVTALEVGVMSHADDDVIFNKMTAAQAGNVTVTGDNTSNDLTFALDSATGTSDALTLNLASATATSNVDVGLLTMTGFESLTVNATTGTAGTSSDVAFKSAGADKLTSVSLTGAADMGLNGSNTSKAMTVNGSAMTGKATIAGNFVTGSTVTTGSGADSIALGTGFATYNAGTGNDNFTATTVASINTGTSYNVMNGGEGTDTLTLTADDVAMVDDNFKSLSGLEKFVVDADGGAGNVSLVTGGWYNTAFATSGSDVTVLGADGDALTFTGSSFTGAQKLTLTTLSDGATTADNVVIATGSGADTVTVTASSWVGHATTAGLMTIATGDGNDTINVTTGTLLATDEANGEILGITAGKGADNITISHTNAASAAGSATITIAAGDSTQTAYDSVTGFKMGDIAGTGGLISDGLDFATVSISGAVSATAVTGFTTAELAITIATTGKATFSGTQAASITDAQALAAVDQVITNGKTAFYTDGTDTFVFNADASGDSVVELIGVAAATLITTNDSTTDDSIFIV